MSQRQSWAEWISESRGWILGAIGLVTSIVTFIVFFKANLHLAATVTITILLVSIFLVCVYLSFAKTPPLVAGGKGVYRFDKWRRWTLGGIVLIPVLTGAVLLSDHGKTFVQSAILGTPTPTVTSTPTVMPTAITTLMPPTMPEHFAQLEAFSRQEAILFRWNWTGKLDPDVRFALRVWSVDEPEQRHSLVWTRESEYMLQVRNEAFPPGNYYWNVAVVRDVAPLTESGLDDTWEFVVRSAPRFVQIPER